MIKKRCPGRTSGEVPASSPFRAVLAGLLALCAAVALGACGEREEPAIAEQPQPEFSIEGRWAGELHQRGLRPFRVTVTIDSLERTKGNVVRYSGIDCGGTWEFLGADDSSYRFRELIDRGGGGDCKGTGTVRLTPLTQDRVAYEFSGGGVRSAGRLDRG